MNESTMEKSDWVACKKQDLFAPKNDKFYQWLIAYIKVLKKWVKYQGQTSNDLFHYRGYKYSTITCIKAILFTI
jgi:hypothetical protein